jgi:hypothetical protein
VSDNALTIGTAGSLPAHVASLFGGVESNIPDKQTVPSLSYEGKVWTISKDGSKQKLMTRNSDGDEIPLSVMRVVILDSAARRGRQYYEGTYDPNKISAPRCWSADGVAPDRTVKEPIAATCDQCPNSVKGSKVLDNGNATVACSQHRMLAVVPAGRLDFTPLRLKIAITSDWDSQSPDMEAQGWYSYSKYLDFLKSRGVPHTAALVTKIRFDANAAYPKLFFAADRWLNDEEAAVAAPRLSLPEVKKLIDGSWTPAGVDGVPTEGVGQSTAPQASPAPSNVVPIAGQPDEPEPPFEVAESVTPETASAAPEGEGDEIVIMLDEEPTPEVKPARKPAAKKAETKPAAEATPAASTDVPDDLAELLGQWGD